jgi:hypothetical protein
MIQVHTKPDAAQGPSALTINAGLQLELNVKQKVDYYNYFHLKVQKTNK